MKMRHWLSIFAAVLIVSAASSSLRAAEAKYLSARFCRACHSSADNDRYHRWLQTKHAKAYEALQGAEKKNPVCLHCHTTGNGEPISDRIKRKDLRGVQCEACHGAGSLYKSNKVMKNRKKAIEMGLILPTRMTCLKCHR